MSVLSLSKAIKRFRKRDDGTALVEFAVFLPLFLLSFAIIVEFSRLFFSYQGAVEGVRDAARYLARVTDGDICVGQSAGSGINLTVINPNTDNNDILLVIKRNMDNEVGELPVKVELQQVVLSYECVVPAAGTYRQKEVPIARVAADFKINFPLEGVFRFNSINNLLSVQHTIVDQSRIYGV